MSESQYEERLRHDPVPPVPPVAKVPYYLVIGVFMLLNIDERIKHINTLLLQFTTYSPVWVTENTTQVNNYNVIEQTLEIFKNLLQEYNNVRTGNFDTNSVKNILQKFEKMKTQLYEMAPQITSDTLKTLGYMQTINLTQWTENQMPMSNFKCICFKCQKIYLLFLCTNLLKYKHMHAILCTKELDKFYIFMKDTITEQDIKVETAKIIINLSTQHNPTI